MNQFLYKNSQEEFIDTNPMPWDLLVILDSLKRKIEQFVKQIKEHKESLPKSIFIELDIVEGSINEGYNNLNAVLEQTTENVQWSSFIKGKYHPLTILHSAPLKVNNFIHNQLIARYPGGVFCSATITVNEEFTYFSEKIVI